MKQLENPATRAVRDVETRMTPAYSELLCSQGRLYMSATYASELTSSVPDTHVIAFGTPG